MFYKIYTMQKKSQAKATLDTEVTMIMRKENISLYII